MSNILYFLPPGIVWLGPNRYREAELFDPAEFLAAVSPAKPEVRVLAAGERVTFFKSNEVTREIELRTRNARNLLRWIARRDAYKQPFGFAVRP